MNTSDDAWMFGGEPPKDLEILEKVVFANLPGGGDGALGRIYFQSLELIKEKSCVPFLVVER